MRHRSTGLHRDTVALVQGGQVEARACTHCGERMVGLAKLEEHLATEHRLLLPQCHLCGLPFHFPQQLPPHLKLACHAKDPGVGLGICSDGSFKCTLCNFTSHQELLLTLHSKSPAGGLAGQASSVLHEIKIISSSRTQYNPTWRKRAVDMQAEQLQEDYMTKARAADRRQNVAGAGVGTRCGHQQSPHCWIKY